jgi:hypothetical protein
LGGDPTTCARGAFKASNFYSKSRLLCGRAEWPGERLAVNNSVAQNQAQEFLSDE